MEERTSAFAIPLAATRERPRRTDQSALARQRRSKPRAWRNRRGTDSRWIARRRWRRRRWRIRPCEAPPKIGSRRRLRKFCRHHEGDEPQGNQHEYGADNRQNPSSPILRLRYRTLDSPGKIVRYSQDQTSDDFDRKHRTAVPFFLVFPQIGLDLSTARATSIRIHSPRVQRCPSPNSPSRDAECKSVHAGATRLRPRLPARARTLLAPTACAAAIPSPVSTYSRRPGLFSSAAICGSSHRLRSSPMCCSRPSARYKVPYAVRRFVSEWAARCRAS
jgi:hypothetical protein